MICDTCHNAVKDANWKRTGYCWKLIHIPVFVRYFGAECGYYDHCGPERCNCQKYQKAIA